MIAIRVSVRVVTRAQGPTLIKSGSRGHGPKFVTCLSPSPSPSPFPFLFSSFFSFFSCHSYHHPEFQTNQGRPKWIRSQVDTGNDMGMGTARDRAWFVMWLRGAAVHRGPAPQRPGAAEARRHKGPRPRLPADATPWVWANMGKEARGFGLPWAFFFGLGYRGQTPLGVGLPWAKFIWVWATAGTDPPRVWATVGKKYLGLGYHGQKITWVWATMGKIYPLLHIFTAKISCGHTVPRRPSSFL